MVATITLLCLMTCPSDTSNVDHQRVNEEWRTHTVTGELVNAVWDETHPTGWDKAMRIPVGTAESYAAATSETGLATRMGNGGSDVEQWRPLVAGQFPPEQVDNALCVIKSESGGEPHIRNLAGSNARGLFQIMSTVWGPVFDFTHEDFYSPELNTYAAARIWERSGWEPWSPRTRRLCGL